MKTDAVVVIPAYRPIPLDWEAFTLKRTAEVLKDYEIVIVAPHRLDGTPYESIAPQARFERFDDAYFQDVNGYSRLCMSTEFYQRFAQYPYLLICQLDALVFQDQLSLWCDKGFDFVGSAIAKYSKDDGTFMRWIQSQNGGFSLRNVEGHLRALTSRKRVNGFHAVAIAKNMHRDLGGYTAREENSLFWNTIYSTKFGLKQLAALGRKDDAASFIEQCFQEGDVSEDQFWTRQVGLFDPAFKLAPLAEAQKFGIQNGLELTQDQFRVKPPFGCHGPEFIQALWGFATLQKTPKSQQEQLLWDVAHTAGILPNREPELTP